MKSDSGNKGRILDTAAQLILRRGAQNTSLADIAREVGISKGTLYYYYSSKADLIADITKVHVGRITDKIIEQVDAIKDHEDPEAVLALLFDSVLKGEMHGKLHLFLIQEAITNNQTILDTFRDIYLHWRNVIHDRLSEILPASYDVDALTRIILCCIDGAVIQNMIGLWDDSGKRIVSYLLEDGH